ncbi:IDEAL domain-containing protein [Lysinibacillus sp. NPDC058147]|uniref:IDEAL domain-containing protein n=1 Tax=unclassified Lysinibacillus TaxID=2636778 RepID=UPI0036DB21D2
MDFWKLVSDVAEAAKELHREQREKETNDLMSEIEAFNVANAIDKALATGDREAFNKLVGSEMNG